MAYIARRGTSSLLLSLCFSSFVFAQGNLLKLAQSDEEAAVRTLAERYFQAWQKEDLDAAVGLWSEKSPELAQAKARLKEFFSLNDRIETRNLNLRRLVFEVDRATALATVEVAATDARTNTPSQGLGKMTLNMTFVREAGEWKVWRSASAEEELAARLITTKGETERAALFAEDEELLTPALAFALYRAGERFRFRQELEQAMTAYRLQLLVGERTANKRVVAAAFHNMAMAYRAQGDYEQSLNVGQRSLKLKEEMGNKASAALTLEVIADAFEARSHYTAAMETFQRMLAIGQELNDKRLTAKALHGFGMVHASQGNTTAALDYFQRSLALSQEAGDKIVSSGALQSIGALQLELGDYNAALEAFRRNLAQLEAAGHKTGVAHAIRDVGYAYRAQGDHLRATENFERALILMEETGFKEGIADILRALAVGHMLQGDYEKVLARVSRSADLERQIGSLSRLVSSLTFAGQAYQALGRTNEARRAFEEAIAALETLRTQVAGAEQDRQRYFEERVSPYYAMVQLLVAQNKIEEAFLYAERAKGRVLLDVLRAGRMNVAKVLTVQEREQEKVLAEEIASLNRQILSEGSRTQPDPARLAQLKAQLEKARFAHADFQVRLYAAHPDLRVQRGEARPFSLDQAGELLTAPKTALLEYVVTDKSTYLFVLTQAANAATPTGPQQPLLKIYDLKTGRKELTGRVQTFRQRIANNDLGYSAQSADLYNLLIRPAEAQLRGKTRLVIVPDDVLWDTPFQALRPAGGKYLIQTAAMSFAPSLTVLREMTRSKRNRAAGGTLLAMGNPQLNPQTVSRSKNVLLNATFQPLPEAERMVKSLTRIYGPAKSQVYVGAVASEDVLKAEAGKYRVIHLAAHAVLNDASPMYSYVVLSQGKGAREDGLVEAWEMMNLDLQADLVVLSACETARGKFGAGESVIGMTWALFVAGVPTLVVSQWKVESVSTTELMIEFHRSLRGGVGESEAMRRAAVKLIADRRYEHPFYWAGFIVGGDGR